jgi:type VI secretion system secreted protein Hcp
MAAVFTPQRPAGLAEASGIDVYLDVQAKRAGKIRGEAAASGFEGDIIVSRWSWGVEATSAAGSARALARRAYDRLVIIKSIDSATTGLLSALATNDELRDVRLAMRRAGEGQSEFFTLRLKAARLVDLDLTTDEQGSTQEQLAFTFTEVEVEYRPQLGTGLRGGSFTFNDRIDAQ